MNTSESLPSRGRKRRAPSGSCSHTLPVLILSHRPHLHQQRQRPDVRRLMQRSYSSSSSRRRSRHRYSLPDYLLMMQQAPSPQSSSMPRVRALLATTRPPPRPMWGTWLWNRHVWQGTKSYWLLEYRPSFQNEFRGAAWYRSLAVVSTQSPPFTHEATGRESSVIATHNVVAFPKANSIQWVQFQPDPAGVPAEGRPGAIGPAPLRRTVRKGAWSCRDDVDWYSLRYFSLSPSSSSAPSDHILLSLGELDGKPDRTYVTLFRVNGMGHGSSLHHLGWRPLEDGVPGSHFTFRLPHNVHDGALVGLEHFVMAHPTGPIIVSYEGGRLRWNTNRSCDEALFGETLCVESDGTTMPHLAFLGCRCGRTYWIDLRSPNIRVLPSVGRLTSSFDRQVPASTIAPFGSITRLHLLFQDRPGQLLVKSGTTGLCRLHDIRRASSQRESDRDPALVHDFQVPPSLDYRGFDTVRGQAVDRTASCGVHQMASSRCRGMATNPLSTMLLNPLVGTDGTAGIGYWCLTTGFFVGYHAIDLNQTSSNNGVEPESTKRGTPWMELCPTITPVQPLRHLDNDDRFDHHGLFGLWLSCRRTKEQFGPNGLYQVTCPGRVGDFKI